MSGFLLIRREAVVGIMDECEISRLRFFIDFFVF